MSFPPDSKPKGHPMEPGVWPGTPLYPPDAAPGHTPTKDSPLAIAVKRWAAHLGAWPWDPESWDDSYSNAISHGKSGDPDRAGVEAIQRWSGTLDATGWFGEKTFNFARSVLIPQGRSHAGEPAWDSVCVQLTQQALDAATPPAPTQAVRDRALKLATGELGTKESPPGSNMQKYGAYYGENGVPWCAIGMTWAYLEAGHTIGKTFQTVKQAGSNDRYDYVPYIVSDARNGRYGLSVTTSPIPGDLVCFDWNWNGEYDHVGMFEKWQDGKTVFSAIEMNTSTSDNSNGGEVMRRSRNVNSQGTVFVRVHEP